MQTWEYLRLVFHYAKDEYRLRYVNGKEMSNWENSPAINEQYAKFGNEGWELVSEDRNVSINGWDIINSYLDKDFDTNDMGKRYKGIQGFFDWVRDAGKNNWDIAAVAPDAVAGGSNRYFGGFTYMLKRPKYLYAIYAVFKRPKSG